MWYKIIDFLAQGGHFLDSHPATSFIIFFSCFVINCFGFGIETAKAMKDKEMFNKGMLTNFFFCGLDVLLIMFYTS